MAVETRAIEKFFSARPFDTVVSDRFTSADLQVGIAKLVDDAIAFGPDCIVGINRGGAIIGGILGKHLGLLVHIIEVTRDPTKPVIFHTDSEKITGKKVMLVDDRLFTGTNMARAYEFVSDDAEKVRLVVFAWVEKRGCKIEPQAWAYKASSRSVWFPWEPRAARVWH